MGFGQGRHRLGMGAWCVAVALVWFGWQLVVTADDLRDLRQHQQGIAGLERAAAEARWVAIQRDIARHERAVEQAAQLAVPWSEAFDLIEDHARADVTLQRVRVEAGRAQVWLTARSDSAPALQALTQAWSGDGRVDQLHAPIGALAPRCAGTACDIEMVARWRAAVALTARPRR